MASEIGVLGAGGWGTTLAKVLADKGERVSLWCHGVAMNTGAGARPRTPRCCGEWNEWANRCWAGTRRGGELSGAAAVP